MAAKATKDRRQHSGRTDQRKAALKLLEIAIKGDRQRARGAVYLAGYAIECKLKAVAMEKYDCWTLDELAGKWQIDAREIYSHGLESLLVQMSLYEKLRKSELGRDFTNYVNQWRPSWRYSPEAPSVEWAENFMDAVDRVFEWLESNR